MVTYCRSLSIFDRTGRMKERDKTHARDVTFFTLLNKRH